MMMRIKERMRSLFTAKRKSPKTREELGEILRNFHKSDIPRLRKSLEKGYILPKVMLAYSLLGRNNCVARIALEFGADPTSNIFQGRKIENRAISLAIKDNNDNFINMLIDDFPQLVSRRAINTILITFCDSSDRKSHKEQKILTKLLENFSVEEDVCYQVLDRAIASGKSDFLENLIKIDKFTTRIGLENVTQYIMKNLYLASFKVTEFVFNSTDFQADQAMLDSALYLCAQHGRTKICEFLIEKGADVNHLQESYIGKPSPLSAALIRKREETAYLLIEKGADLIYGNRHTIIDAAKSKSYSLIELIIAQSDTIPKKVASHALLVAISDECVSEANKVCKALLELGADMLYSDKVNLDGKNAVCRAIKSCNSELFFLFAKEYQQQHGMIDSDFLDGTLLAMTEISIQPDLYSDSMAKINNFMLEYSELFSQYEKDYALLQAAEIGLLKLSEFLIEIGSNPSALIMTNTFASNKVGTATTSLIQAAREDNFDVALFLANNGARINDETDEIIQEISEAGELTALSFLINHGATLPLSLSSDNALEAVGSKTWIEAINNVHEEESYKLRGILPYYLRELNVAPLDYISDCPDWHKPYVLECISNSTRRQA